MSIQHRIDGVLVTGKVSVPQDTDGGLVSAAERGAIGRGGVTFEDPDGTFDLTAWRNYTVDDTAATPTRVFTGRIIDRNIGRGNQPPAGAARTYDCTVEDQNGLLHMVLNRIIDNDAKRPAETDVARVAWLLTSRALDTIVFDEGLVSTLNPGSFLASDCRRRFADDVMAEMAPSAVKNFFVYRDETSGNPALFYDKDTAAVWAATIAISNDIADVDDNTVFFPDRDAVLQRGDPADGPYTGVDYGWQGEGFFAESAATIAAYGMRREIAYDNPRAGVLATAQANAEAWLNVHANETDFITVSVLLPASHVNTVYAGQEIDVKFTHMPGYEDFVTTRVRRRTARPVVSDGKWALDLELWVPSTPVDDATVGGECVPEASVAQLQGEDRNGTGPETYDLTWNNTGDNPDAGHPPLPLAGLLAYYLPVGTGATGIECLGSGDLTVTLLADVALVATGTYNAQFQVLKNGEVVLYQAHSTSGGLRFESWTTSPLTGTVSVVNGDILTVRYIDNADYSTDTFPAGVDDTDLTVEGDLCDIDPADEPLPILGEPVGPETAVGDVDGVNTEFSTPGSAPFLPGTLRVEHDGINETSSILTSDPTTGAFELDYAPSVGSVIEVMFQSA